MAGFLKEAGEIIGYSLIVLAPYLIKEAKAFIKSKGDYLSKNLKIRKQIDTIVNEIRIHIDVNRVSILEFSNTEKSTGGFPFEFMNMTYEHTDSILRPIKNDIQKKNVSGLLDWLSPIADDVARYHIFQNDDPTLTDEMRFRMKELALSTVIYFKITDKIKTGVIMIHTVQPYMEDWTVTELRSKHHDHFLYLKFQTARIYTLMKQLKK